MYSNKNMAVKFLESSSVDTCGLCCSICLDRYRDPRSLVCLHTFCEQCINECVMEQQNTRMVKLGIECPLCRKITHVTHRHIAPEMWSKTIPANYALQEVIETLTKDIFVKNDNEIDTCTQHTKPIEFYCTEEKSLCCSTCAVNKLKEGKTVDEINDIAEGENEKLIRPLQRQLDDLDLKTNNFIYFLNKQETDLDVQICSLDLEMKDIQDVLVEKIEDSRAIIMSKATLLKHNAVAQYRINREKCTKLSAQLEETKNTFDKAMQCKSQAETFIALHKVEERANVLTENMDNVQLQITYLDIVFQLDKMVNQILDVTDLKLGELHLKYIKPESSDFSDSRSIQLKKITSLNILRSQYDQKEPLYSGMEFLPDGRLVIVDNANWKLVVLNKRFEAIGSLQFSSHIFDVVSTSSNEIYVTGVKRLQRVILDNNERFTCIETTKLETYPFSVYVLSNDRFVIGTYRTDVPVRMLSKAGVGTNFEMSFPKKQWKIDDSRCAFDAKDNVLALTDRYDHSVYIYDTRTRHEVRVKDEKIIEPRGVAIGPRGCIFVCSKGTNSVVQLSKYGELLGDCKLDMMYPCTICFSKDNILVAISNSYADAKKLQIFQIISGE